jgi:hypothetical protein
MTTPTPQQLRYPDTGHPLEDAGILRNAVRFSTTQRAYSADALNRVSLDKLNDQGLAFAAVDAYCAEMTTAEDILGWLFVLKDWKPGTPEGSLFALLSKVQVGVDPWNEAEALGLLEALDVEGLRKLLHVPTDDELRVLGFDADLREAVGKSITANLGGFKRVASYRLRDRRGFVVGFNKLKHLLLAMPTKERGKNEVLVPQWLKKGPTGRAYHLDADGIHIQNLWIEASPENVRLMASRAVIGQAVLNCLLGLILWTRFGQPYETPQWAAYALNLSGWLEDEPRA